VTDHFVERDRPDRIEDRGAHRIERGYAFTKRTA
jgi:hypothetical protein